MPAAPNVAQPEIIHRSVRMRLLPESRAAAQQLAGNAGACRKVWNHFRARIEQEYADYKAGARVEAPRLTFFSLGKEFTALRRDLEYAWLQEYSFKSVRYVLKYLADAYQAFFQWQRAYPSFKSKHARQDGFTIPERVQVSDHHLHVPRIGWLRLKGSNLYAHGQAGTGADPPGRDKGPKWYVYLTYAVPAASVRTGAATGVLGLDRNVGQVTDSEGTLYPLTDLRRLDSKIARKQRLQARKRKGSVQARRLGGQLTKLRRQQNGCGPMTPTTSAGPWRTRLTPWWRRNCTPRA